MDLIGCFHTASVVYVMQREARLECAIPISCACSEGTGCPWIYSVRMVRARTGYGAIAWN